jgi:hypothetical protein
VNGQSTEGLTTDQVSNILRGKSGTAVTVKVGREAVAKNAPGAPLTRPPLLPVSSSSPSPSAPSSAPAAVLSPVSASSSTPSASPASAPASASPSSSSSSSASGSIKKEMVQVSLRREKVELSPLFALEIPHAGDLYGYLKLQIFSQRAPELMREAIQSMERDGVKGEKIFIYLFTV